MDPRAYKRAHEAPRERLHSWGYARPDKVRGIKGDIDEGASDATRLSYAPMFQPGRESPSGRGASSAASL